MSMALRTTNNAEFVLEARNSAGVNDNYPTFCRRDREFGKVDNK
jgi:hypothetical protein